MKKLFRIAGECLGLMVLALMVLGTLFALDRMVAFGRSVDAQNELQRQRLIELQSEIDKKQVEIDKAKGRLW